MIKQINRKNILSYNSRYNNSIDTILESIFQSEDEGHIGYQSSKTINLNKKEKNLVGIDTNSNNYIGLSNKIDNHGNIILKDLPAVERHLAYSLCFLSYTNIVVTGALGSGKTALVKFTLQKIKDLIIHEYCSNYQNCIFKSVKIFHLNFNANYPDNSVAAIKKFRNDLYIYLYDFLRDIFESNNIMDNFINIITDSRTNDIRVIFRRFVDKISLYRSDFQNKPIVDKILLLFEWIDNRSDKLNYLITLLDFVLSNGFYKRCCLICFFDNIDRLSDVAQNQILFEIMTFAEKTKVKTITCLRLTNFCWINGEGSFSFGHFPNAGPRPIEIIKLRIKHFLDFYNKKPYSELLNSLDNSTDLDHLLIRMQYVYNLLDKKNGRVYITLTALSGNSIRRALQISKKLFKNGIAPYNENKPYEDSLSHSLLHYTTNQSSPKFDTKFVTNLFSNSNGEFSLLSLRILQIIVIHHHKYGDSLSLGRLLNQVNSFTNIDDDTLNDEIVFSINRLIRPVVKLAFIDSNQEFDTYIMLIKCKQSIVHPTWSGILYYDRLLGTLTYILECFLRVKWNQNDIDLEFDFEKISSRMKALRICLMKFYEYDKNQMFMYRSKYKGTRNFLIDTHISIHITTKLAHIFLKIIRKKKYISREIIMEMRNWLSFMISLFNYEYKEWDFNRTNLSKLITEFNKFIEHNSAIPG